MENDFKKIAVIAGAGPAGLTAALELLRTTDVKPVIFEAENVIGGVFRARLVTMATAWILAVIDFLARAIR